MNLDDYTIDITELEEEIKMLKYDRSLVEWLKKELVEINAQWREMSSDEAKFHLLSRTRDYLQEAKKSQFKPKIFLEIKLMRNRYHMELLQIEADIRRTKLMNDAKVGEFIGKIDTIEQRVKKEDPEYFEIIRNSALKLKSFVKHLRYGLRNVHVQIR